MAPVVDFHLWDQSLCRVSGHGIFTLRASALATVLAGGIVCFFCCLSISTYVPTSVPLSLVNTISKEYLKVNFTVPSEFSPKTPSCLSLHIFRESEQTLTGTPASLVLGRIQPQAGNSSYRYFLTWHFRYLKKCCKVSALVWLGLGNKSKWLGLGRSWSGSN